MSFQVITCHHTRNQSVCEECIYGYPRKCKCGGYVHAEHMASESAKQSNLFKYLCDKCGDNFLKQSNNIVKNRNIYRKKSRKNKK